MMRMNSSQDVPSSLEPYLIYFTRRGITLNSMYNNHIIAFCPLHNDTGTPNFHVWEDSGRWFCFRCRLGGDFKELVRLVQWPKIQDRKVALDNVNKYLDKTDFVYTPILVPSSRKKYNATLAQRLVIDQVSEYYMTLLPERLKNYLRDRGITDNQIKQYRFGYADPDSVLTHITSEEMLQSIGLIYADTGGYRLTNRLTLPIQDNGNIIARATWDTKKQKYIYLPIAKSLFSNTLAQTDQSPIVLVEGPFDALAVERAGYPGVAVGGTHLRSDQFELFTGYHVILCLDGDTGGKEAMDDYEKRFASIVASLSRVYLPPGRDPGDFAAADELDTLARHIETAVPVF